MPLFHFNSRIGDEVLPDAEGEELPNVSAACEVAIAIGSGRLPMLAVRIVVG
jgi:hypothetical protein